MLGGLFLVSTATLAGYLTMWYTTTSLLPVGVHPRRRVAGSKATDADAATSGRQLVLFLLLALSAFVGLVQFPFGAPVYFCFVAPLAVLAWLAMFRHTSLRAVGGPRSSRWLLLASDRRLRVRRRTTASSTGTGRARTGIRRPSILDRDRAWIRVSPSQRAVYLEVMALLTTHARGSYIYAGPDTPEIYALTGLRNPTRSLFDYLDPSDSARGQNLLRALRAPRGDGDRRSTRDPASLRPSAGAPSPALRDEYPLARDGRAVRRPLADA